MDSDDIVGKRGRGRGRGTRARGIRGRGRGRGGRGKKATRVISSDDEISQDPAEQNVRAILTEELLQEHGAEVEEIPDANKENEMQIVAEEAIAPPTIDMEADISQLEAPTFTTISRGPPEPMLRLKWDHKVSLIGEKVLNPMIHCCDQCDKPILVYGRMIPCKHIFCLKCARAEPVKICPRCKDKVVRVEQSGLGTVFMCTHGGSRYGNTGCRRTYLSQRDLQAHINHRHVTIPLTITAVESSHVKPAAVVDSKTVLQRKSSESAATLGSTVVTSTSSSNRPPPRSSLLSHTQTISVRSNLSLQEAQQALGKVTIQQSCPVSSSHVQHHQQPEAVADASYYSSVLSSYGNTQTTSFVGPPVQSLMPQNYGHLPPMGAQSGVTSVMSGIPMPLVSQAAPPPPLPPQGPPAFYAYGQQFGQLPPPHFQYDQSNFPGNPNNPPPQWNPQQYYR